jgi:hypothetical protein
MMAQLPPPASAYHWSCCDTYRDRDEFFQVLQHMDLSIMEKQIILSRFVHLIEHLSKRVRIYMRIFYVGHAMITVGSLFVPALLSIQNSTGATQFSNQIYWATFIISLLVTTCNGILTLFKIDKKFYFLNTTLERLRTEGWQYVGLTGRYAGQAGEITTHRSQFIFFTHQIEKIKMKQVEEEYYKSDENATHLPAGTRAQNDLHPLSPERPAVMEEVPEPVKDALTSMLHPKLVRRHTIHPNSPQGPPTPRVSFPAATTSSTAPSLTVPPAPPAPPPAPPTAPIRAPPLFTATLLSTVEQNGTETTVPVRSEV